MAGGEGDEVLMAVQQKPGSPRARPDGTLTQCAPGAYRAVRGQETAERQALEH